MKLSQGEIYDLLYREKPYREEANEIRRIVKVHHPLAHTILDLGCGTAQHHLYLRKEFEIDGVDLDASAIALARKKNPDGNYVVEDMAAFDTGKKYDVILSLFSSFGYLTSQEKIDGAIKHISDHLNPKGLVIIEPWLEHDDWQDGVPHMQTYMDEQWKICRTNVSKSKGKKSILDFHFLISEKDGDSDYFQEKHELLFHHFESMKASFLKYGIIVISMKNDLFRKGLLLGKQK
jgi:SAM-dependent methyltransferase